MKSKIQHRTRQLLSSLCIQRGDMRSCYQDTHIKHISPSYKGKEVKVIFRQKYVESAVRTFV